MSLRMYLFACVAAGLTLAAEAASPSVWNVDGSGGWKDASRWVDGNVPQSGYQVRSHPDAPMFADDGDAEILGSIKEIVLEGAGSRLVVTNRSAMSLSFKIWGEGRFEKAGAGTLTFEIGSDSERIYCGGGAAVYDGVLSVSSREGREHKMRGPVAVYGNGVFSLIPNNYTTVAGLKGDGTIRNDATSQMFLIVTNNAAAGEYVFSGGLSGDFLCLGMHCGTQDLAGTASSNSQQGRIYGGTLRAASFGEANNSVSSWGKKELVFVGMPGASHVCKVEYIGQGETTRRPVYCNENIRHVALSGGLSGGLELQGGMNFTVSRMTTLELGGDNVRPCVIDCDVIAQDGCAVYVRKTGCGTWRLAANPGRSARKNKGVVAVEKGVLEYETVANAGTGCSLGDASVLHAEYAGERDDGRAVGYAHLLGDGTAAFSGDTATMRYTGPDAADIRSRPVAVNGAARFESAVADLAWSGFSALSSSGGALAFGGGASGCFAADVTDGNGVMSVLKEGGGTWTLGGNLGFSGPVGVGEGELRLQNSSRYTWYRLTVKELYGKSRQEIMLSRIALFSQDGEDQALGISHDPSCDGRAQALPPGRACLATAGLSADPNHPLDNLFKEYERNQNGRWGRNPRANFSADDPDTWAAIVFRLPEGAKEVVRYDMVTGWFAAESPFEATPSDWVLEGSTDGMYWKEIESGHSSYGVFLAGANYWMSDRSPADASPAGFPVAPSCASKQVLASIPSLSLAAGASFASDAPVEVGDVVYALGDAPASISGVSFADSGVLRLVGDGAGAVEIACDLSGCLRTENLPKWRVYCNGKFRSALRVRAVPGGLSVRNAGMTMVLR